MTRSRVIDRDRGYKALKRRLLDLGDKEVAVGIPEDATYPNGTPVALVGAVHEFGNAEHKAKAPLRKAFDRGKAEVRLEVRKVARAIVDGRMTEEQALLGLGEKQVELVRQEVIRAGLVDSGRLRDSYQAEVRKKGDRR